MRFMKWAGAAISGAVMMAAPGEVGAAVHFIASGADLSASVQGPTSNISDYKNGGIANPGTYSVIAKAYDQYSDTDGNQITLSSMNILDANIINPGKGSVNFDQKNLISGTEVFGYIYGLQGYSSLYSNFYYDFSVDTTSDLIIKYKMSTSGYNNILNLPISQGFYIQDMSSWNILASVDEILDTSNGIFIISLNPGVYRLDINDFYLNAITGDNITGQASLLSSRYDFQITPNSAVPEPATWALMIIGFGSIGAAMRRGKRPVPATA